MQICIKEIHQGWYVFDFDNTNGCHDLYTAETYEEAVDKAKELGLKILASLDSDDETTH